MTEPNVTPDQMWTAADILEEWSEYMDYSHPDHADWCAHDLRREADILEMEE